MEETYMAGCHFVEGYEDFPVCNHVLEVDSENIGYQTGMFDDGLPFEVEEYEYGENDNRVRELAIIFPDLCVEDDDCDDSTNDSDNNIEGYRYSMDVKECSVLPIGMVFRGQESNFSIIEWYQEFIEEAGIVEYLSNVRSCSVFYYTDINGNDLVQVRIGLVAYGQEEAVSNIKMRDFPMHNRPQVKLQVVK